MKRELLDALLADRAAKKPVVLATTLGTGEQWLICANGCTPGAPDDVIAAARAALAADKSQTVEGPDGPVFLQVHNPPLRMIVVGAVHIAQALAPMAALAGYQVTVVDPRGAFATQDRFPGVDVTDDWPDEAMETLAPDSRTAVVTLTHDPKLDDPALVAALGSPAFYIGALGSRMNQAKRLERMKEGGFDDAALARIHGPVGLRIGARTPAEIAVAIMAEVVRELRLDV